MAKLTDSVVRKLPAPDKGNKITYEGGGFGVRVTAAGTKSFVLTYRVDGHQRRITIGPYPAWSVKAARDRAAELRLAADKGKDPLEERQGRREAETIGELVDRYIREYCKSKDADGNLRKRSWRQDERRLEKYVLPVWKNRKIRDIRRRDVLDLGEAIEAPVEANRVVATIRGMFSFAVDKSLVETHPCLGIRKINPEAPRSRTLRTNDEFRALWEITSGSDEWAGIIPTRQAAALRLLFLLGQRNSEVAGMRWAELDLDSAEWLIPPERYKSNRPHLVPLPPVALSIIQAQPRNGEFVFAGARGGPLTKKHLSDALGKASAALADRGIERFTPHDLRRTVETGLAKLKVPKEYRDRVLGHVDGSVGGMHYNTYEYLEEKREALSKWEAHAVAIVEPTIGEDADTASEEPDTGEDTDTIDNLIQFPRAG